MITFYGNVRKLKLIIMIILKSVLFNFFFGGKKNLGNNIENERTAFFIYLE